MVINRLKTVITEPSRNTAYSEYADALNEDTTMIQLRKNFERYLMKYPGTLVVAAMAIGITLGWLGKRK